MGQALYRKYRSRSLSEIVGQEHITDTLHKALQGGRISHAYLFTGPRGVGKTSIARILAHEINGLPYDEGQTHMDIIEIDAASNRRIDEIRDLRDKVYIAPAQAKYKVYIIDEVHMLTREAFNALLKTLEEPPAHAVFILATTEAHKLPETIISRTQRFVFRPAEPAKTVALLRSIATSEKINITDEALEFIAQHGGGSFRDSVGLLDQAASSSGKVDIAAVQAMLGVPPLEAVQQLLQLLETRQSASALLQQLTELYDGGFQAAAVAKQLASALREQVINGTTTMPVDGVMQLLGNLLDVQTSHDPERYLEIILLSLTYPVTPATVAPASAPQPAAAAIIEPKQAEPISKPAAKPAAMKHPETEKTNADTTADKPKVTPKKAPPTEPAQAPKPPEPGDLNEATWAEVVSSLKSHYNTLYGIVRMAKPDFSELGKLGLTFAFAFHQKRMSEAKNAQIIGDAIRTITGSDVEIHCTHDPGLKLADKSASPELRTIPEADKASDQSLANISNIFGGGELLQS